MRGRLDGGCIVVLSNLGYSSSGEVLNCNTYEVATASAFMIGADKLIRIIDGPVLDDNGRLIRFLPLDAADEPIRKRATHSEVAATYVETVSAASDNSPEVILPSGTVDQHSHGKDCGEMLNATFQNGVGFNDGNGVGVPIGGREQMGRLNGYLSELAAASFVRRILEKVDSYVVMERDGHIIEAGALFIFAAEKCAEVAAIAVAPECRGQGQGDKLLDYMEKKAIAAGLHMLFLLTTRTADWIVRRGFVVFN